MTYSGIISSWNGITCTSSTSANVAERPRHFSTANAYPASTPNTIVPRITPPVKMPELTRPFSRLMRPSIAV